MCLKIHFCLQGNLQEFKRLFKRGRGNNAQYPSCDWEYTAAEESQGSNCNQTLFSSISVCQQYLGEQDANVCLSAPLYTPNAVHYSNSKDSQKRGARRCPGCLPEPEVSVVTLLRLIRVLTARKVSEVRLHTALPLWSCIELKHWIPRCHVLANWQKLLRRED